MFKGSAFENIYLHWCSLPVLEGSTAPLKSAFNPAAVRADLSHIIIVERIARYETRIRLSGTEIDQEIGKNITGTNTFDYYNPADLEFYADWFDCILGVPCSSILRREFWDRKDRASILTLCCLPLSDQAGINIFVLGFNKVESTHFVSAPIPSNQMRFTSVNSVEYVDLGYGLPDHAPKLPASK